LQRGGTGQGSGRHHGFVDTSGGWGGPRAVGCGIFAPDKFEIAQTRVI
jgi:hypothetical protein